VAAREEALLEEPSGGGGAVGGGAGQVEQAPDLLRRGPGPLPRSPPGDRGEAGGGVEGFGGEAVSGIGEPHGRKESALGRATGGVPQSTPASAFMNLPLSVQRLTAGVFTAIGFSQGAAGRNTP
jgi:hypothetical protein